MTSHNFHNFNNYCVTGQHLQSYSAVLNIFNSETSNIKCHSVQTRWTEKFMKRRLILFETQTVGHPTNSRTILFHVEKC
jgi:hypothetical protein